MIRVGHGPLLKHTHFPDGTQYLVVPSVTFSEDDMFYVPIYWKYESDEEMVTLMYIVNHIREKCSADIWLSMPYIPNARMDRVEDTCGNVVFTLKYFCKFINSLNFARVDVWDPHSYVCVGMLDHIRVNDVTPCIAEAISKARVQRSTHERELALFFPDAGAMKRYSSCIPRHWDGPILYGDKQRDWTTGDIKGLEIRGDVASLKGRAVLIIDDICSRGSTFLHSASQLKDRGADEIFLYVTHCENTILKGELLEGDLIKKVYTTDSLITKTHEKIEVMLHLS